MKKLKNNMRTIFTVCIMACLVLGCKKDSNDVLSLPRPFTPSTITGTNGETSVKVTWPVALFTTAGQATYSVDFSKDPNFADGTIEVNLITQDLSVTVTDDKLTIKADYYARVKTMGINGSPDSNYVVSSSFRITGEQFLNVPGVTDITDVGVQFTWRPNPDLVKITVTPYTITPPSTTPVYGTPFDVPLSPTDLAANNKQLPTGLTQKTNYRAEVFSATKNKGTVTFKTVPSITGNLVILDASIGSLIAAVGTAPSGSVIVAARGAIYDMTTSTTINNKSLTFRTALGFGTNYATLRIGGLSAGTSFNFLAGSNIDSIVFRDMILKGRIPVTTSTFPSYDNHYVINNSSLGNTIKLVRFDNCTVKILRGMVRGQGGAANATTGVITSAATNFNNYVINNCVIDSVKDFSIVQASGGNVFQNITIANTTIYKTRKFIVHSNTPSTLVTISNCTFNESPSNFGTSANYFIDYGIFPVTNGITMTNCIMGVSWLETGGTIPPIGYRGASTLALNNTYTTTEIAPTLTLITGTVYAGNSTSLYTDPANGNFKIKDTSFAGRSSAGDPRWRIN